MKKKILALATIAVLTIPVGIGLGACKAKAIQPPTWEITDDGYLMIDGVKTDKKLVADKVDVWTIGNDGFWYKNGQKTTTKALGENGKAGDEYTIGADGFWLKNGEYTGFRANGTNGTNGKNGIRYEIGANGNWWSNADDGVTMKDTGLRATADIWEIKQWTDSTEPDINGNLGTATGKFYWYKNGKRTSNKANGDDSEYCWQIEYVDPNETDPDRLPPAGKPFGDYWFIYDNAKGKYVNYGVMAQGKIGSDGDTPWIKWYNKSTNTPNSSTDDPNDPNNVRMDPTDYGVWYIGITNTTIIADGSDGKNGEDGKDGLQYYISPSTGNWAYLEDDGNGNQVETDTGIKAKADIWTIGPDGFWYLNGTKHPNNMVATADVWEIRLFDTSSQDENGVTISPDGSYRWFKNGKVTDKVAVGTPGKNADVWEIKLFSSPEEDENGNTISPDDSYRWFKNGKVTEYVAVPDEWTIGPKYIPGADDGAGNPVPNPEAWMWLKNGVSTGIQAINNYMTLEDYDTGWKGIVKVWVERAPDGEIINDFNHEYQATADSWTIKKFDTADGLDLFGVAGADTPNNNYYWYINNIRTANLATCVPTIGANGNWWIDGVDTGKEAVIEKWVITEKPDADGIMISYWIKIGKDGHQDTSAGEIRASAERWEIKNGTWWKDGVNTDEPAVGPKGDKGNDAMFEYWRDTYGQSLIDDGKVGDGVIGFTVDDLTYEHFFDWLMGKLI